MRVCRRDFEVCILACVNTSVRPRAATHVGSPAASVPPAPNSLNYFDPSTPVSLPLPRYLFLVAPSAVLALLATHKYTPLEVCMYSCVRGRARGCDRLRPPLHVLLAWGCWRASMPNRDGLP
jgi:hypothetical protein